MKVLAITATAGRHVLCERVVGMFLQQDYENKHLLIWQNSPTPQKLDKDYPNITLVNNYLNRKTGQRYQTLGEIYNDVLDYIFLNVDTLNCDLIYHQDDDDMFLSNHISKGVEGFERGELVLPNLCKAYKPEQSFYGHSGGVVRTGNNMEPSIFVHANHLFAKGYADESVAHHLKWLNPLLENQEIFIDKDGEPTMVYDWSGTHAAFKTSGDPSNPNNFNNYHHYSTQHGDGVITPWTREQIEEDIKKTFKNA